jgi:tetratricopeptide (TPR) repeat protein
MRLGRESDLEVGNRAFHIVTNLKAGDVPVIETLVVYNNETIHREESEIKDLRPVFKHGQEIAARVEAQHMSVEERLKNGQLGESKPAAQPRSKASNVESLLDHVLTQLAAGDTESAEASLQEILETDPNFTEARELIDVTRKISAGEYSSANPDETFKSGAEAFASGQTREAIEHWKSCLAADSTRRSFQLVLLLATSVSSKRRKAWLQEVLGMGSKLLAEGRSSEAYSLLLVAQSAEQPTTEVGNAPLADPTIQVPTTEDAVESVTMEDATKILSSEDATKVLPSEDVTKVISTEPTSQDEDWVLPEPAETTMEEIVTGAKETTSPPPVPHKALDVDIDLDETILTPSSLPAEPDEPQPLEPLKEEEQALVATESLSTIAEPPPSESAEPQLPEPQKEEVQGPVVDVNAPTIAESPEESIQPESKEEQEVVPRNTDTGSSEGNPVKTQPLSSRSVRSRPKPRPPSFFESSKWLILGGGALVVLVVLAIVAFLVLGGGSNLPTEELGQAESFLNAGNHSEAVLAYNQILSTHGDLAPAYLGRGRAQLGAGNIDLGLADLRKAVELDANNPAIAEELADVLYTRARFNEAIDYYQRALSGKDISAEALYRLGASQVQLNRSDEALKHLDAAFKKDPTHTEARLLYGRLLNRAARYPEAEEVLREANTPTEADEDYKLELAVSLLEQGKLEPAEEVVRQLLNTDSQDSRALTLLGEIYLKRKQYEAARRELIRALRLNPKEARAQLALGRTWLAIGKTRGDRNDLSKARQILADAQGVHEGERLLTLGQISLAEGDTEVAIDLIERSISEEANPLFSRLALAEARYINKDLPGTAAELQRASALAPFDPALSLTMALVYAQLDDAVRATEEYLKAIQGIGMSAPAPEGNGPIVLPHPYVPLPERFDINRSIRNAHRQALSDNEEDATALTLQTLAESASFVVAGTK